MNRAQTANTDRDNLRVALSEVFGYNSFRPYQEEIARAILSGRDVFAVMPTGGGKSLCYQLPALLLDGVCVVISPLLSLMKDQVDAAINNGIAAASLNSTTSFDDRRAIIDALERNQLDLLYVSPERFSVSSFVQYMQTVEVSFFAVDEAHCISQWGHNFRSDYLELGRIVDLFPGRPVAAFTATATERVGKDVVESLKLRDPYRVRASFDRPNLFYQILHKENAEEQILEFLRTTRGESGVVYRSTRKKVEETARRLVEAGYNAAPYHAGMSDEERQRVQDAFAKDETPIIVATVAFGMGIDKSNVRFVVHGDMPADVESYYQETGRAGRDGAPARCLMLFGYQDIAIQKSFLSDYEDEESRAAAERRINEMAAFAQADGCRRVNLLRYFGEEYDPHDAAPDADGDESVDAGGSGDSGALGGLRPRSKTYCGACDYCVGVSERVDATIDAQKALSAMQRTGNRFGAGHLIDVLVGKKTERVVRLGHDRLKTFGVGADRTRVYWRYIYNALLIQGLAELVPNTEYPIMRVTSLGWETMRGKRTFEVVKLLEKKSSKSKAFSASRSSSSLAKELLEGDALELFERLRAKRSEIARKENVPPYVVFNDKTLADMATLRPCDDESFMLVQGVGRKKLQSYGRAFMKVIRAFLQEKGQWNGD